MGYYIPIDQYIDGLSSLVDHASNKLLYHELSGIFELCTKRDGKIEATFINSIWRKYLKTANRTKLLDLGCGVGRICKHLSNNQQLDITGMDISLDQINSAKKQCPNLRFINQDIREIQINDHFNIAICMWSTLNYLSTSADIINFGSSLHKHLKKNGILLIDLPNHNIFSEKPHFEFYKNEYFQVSIWIQKRIIGNLVEGLYLYKINNKINGEDTLFCDQEIHRVYKPDEIEIQLNKWFELRTIYGNYDLSQNFDKDVSDRAILCMQSK